MLVQVAEPAEITLKGNQEMDPIIRNPEGESVFQWMPIEPSFVWRLKMEEPILWKGECNTSHTMPADRPSKDMQSRIVGAVDPQHPLEDLPTHDARHDPVPVILDIFWVAKDGQRYKRVLVTKSRAHA
jgi:hypothetical protein